jgi:hypothetical protein
MSNDSGETWRPVLGYEGFYEVSSLGRIHSLLRMTTCGPRGGGMLRPTPAGEGYLSVQLCREGKTRRRYVHMLACEAFHGPRPDGAEVRHLDGDMLNNAAGNLAWGTKSENAQDSIRHGTNKNLLKTHCPAGHPYEGDNLWLDDGHRRCRACKSEQNRRHSLKDPEKIKAQKRDSARRRAAARTPEEQAVEREKYRLRKARQRARAAVPD